MMDNDTTSEGKKLDRIVRDRFEIHGNRGHIADTCSLFLNALDLLQVPLKEHACRVALTAEGAAERLGKDPRAAFYGGLLHDFGKILMREDLFNGRNITEREYELVKHHAEEGFRLLKDQHLFSALVAGLHHKVTGGGYGIKAHDIPLEIGIETIARAADISRIISAADFADAALHRSTTYKGDECGDTLRERMLKKFGEDSALVEAVLSEAEKYLDACAKGEERNR